MSEPSFNVTKQEFPIIHEIAKRAAKMSIDFNKPIDLTTLEMDLCACHANGCRLKLKELLEADDANFGHDVFGIHFKIDRETGQLTDCFLPRYAERQEV